MSQENVEIVRSGFAAWNAGDMDALADLFADDIVLRLPEGWPEPGPYVGRDEAIRQFKQNREVFESDRLEPITEFMGAGDRVLVRLIWRGMGGEGPESALEWTILCSVRRGRVVSIEYFWDHAEALEAAGLRE